MKIITATGKEYQVQRCYVSDMDGVLNIGVYNITIPDAAVLFGNPGETSKIVCVDEDADSIVEYDGYIYLSLIVAESSLNGVYVVLHK